MRISECPPDTEIIGQMMLPILNNLHAEEIRPFLVVHNLSEIDPEKWYKVKDFLDVLSDVAKAPGGMTNMVAVGMSTANNMVLPADTPAPSLPMVLAMWDQIHEQQHRGTPIGSVHTEKINDTYYRITHAHPYPDDLIYGLAYGMARRFLPKGTQFQVRYNTDLPRKDEGGDATVIDITWS